MTEAKCTFCLNEKELTVLAPLQGASGAETLVPCDRWLYMDDHCIVTLDPTQLSRGHAVAILRQHRSDIADESLTGDEHGRLLGPPNLDDRVKYLEALAHDLRKAL